MSSLRRLLQKSVKDLPEWLQRREKCSEQIGRLRELLGMTQAQLAKRAKQNPRLIRRLESSTEKADPQLSTLQKTAEGLGCELLVQMIPKRPISQLMEAQALKKARQLVQLAKGSSAMEEQQPSAQITELQIQELAKTLLQKPSRMWED